MRGPRRIRPGEKDVAVDTAQTTAITTARSMLFVPGDRPDRFDKAAVSGADAVVLDLEDAVEPDAKCRARTRVSGWLAHMPQKPAVVRINPVDTAYFDEDLAMVREHRCAVMVAKAADPEMLGDFESPVLAIIETALGIEYANAVCGAGPVVRAAFGNVDLATELGIQPDSHVALSYARSRLVMASAAAGIAAPLDGVTTALDDDAALGADLDQARELGFSGKLCIHPKQVPAVNRGFTPSDAKIAWARRVLTAGNGGAAAVDGQLVDKPVLERARAILAERID